VGIPESKEENRHADSAGNISLKDGKNPSLWAQGIAFSERLASWRLLRVILLVLLAVMLILRYAVERLDYDLWWQMALGRYYWLNRTLTIDHTIFSWTPTDPTWVYNTCLGSIVMYLFYTLAGGFGLWLLQWLVFLGIFLSFYVILRVLRQPLDITAITIIAVIGVIGWASLRIYKPELFTPLFICWVGVIFVLVKAHRGKSSLFYIYPFVFAIWVNLHGGFILGFCLLACFFIGEFLNRIFFPRESFETRELFDLGLASALSFFATLINPFGIYYHLQILKSPTNEIYTVSSKYLLAYESLWPYFKSIGSMDLEFFRVGQVALLMAAMALSLVSLFIYQWRQKRSCDFMLIILSAATFWGSMRAVRAIYMFSMFFFFAFYGLLYLLNQNRISAKLSGVSLLVFALLLMNVLYVSIRYGAGNRWFGFGLQDYAPVKEIEFLKQYKIKGPIFNDYLIGGYLLWALYPDYKVFIDPRLGPYRKEVAPDYWKFVEKPQTAQDIENFTRKYAFKTAVIHYEEMPVIFDFLHAGWRLIYFEKNAAVLVHPALLDEIPREVASIDLGPSRFRQVRDPYVLLNVFLLYVNLNLPASYEIYDIYKKNISDCYKLKAEHLEFMENDIRLMEDRLRSTDKKNPAGHERYRPA
jgi:hypothetical protein